MSQTGFNIHNPLYVRQHGTTCQADRVRRGLRLAPRSRLSPAAGAPHPHAALLYLDFLLSREAQALLADSGRLPGRQDVAPADAEMHEGLEFFMSDPLESGRNYSKLAALYDKVLLGK